LQVLAIGQGILIPNRHFRTHHVSKRRADMMSFATKLLLATLLASTLMGTRAFATPESVPAVMQMSAKASSARLVIMAGVTGAESGFTVDWVQKSVYDALGDFPAAGDPALHSSDFVGVPVWIVQGSSGDFTLPPTKWQAVELGELFDESGVVTSATGELDASTDYVIRVKAKASAGYGESAPTAPLVVSTAVQQQNCTFTQGYWKNHPGAWPAGTVKLGTVTYTPAQLLSIFNQPAAGNGLLILAHQLIAAKLNIANGADPTAVQQSVIDADSMIGGLIVPPIGNGYLSPSQTSALTDTLTEYNEGTIGPGHCND